MTRARRALTLALLATLAAAGPARAEMSDNVKLVANVAQPSSISIAFPKPDVMVVSTVTGLFSYDISKPEAPKLLGSLPMYIYENEDMDVDVKHQRVFISRDPRGFTSPAAPGSVFPYGQVQIIDVSDPANMSQINAFFVDAGHTTTCVNDCDVIWTAGPGANPVVQPADYVGRPVYGTDVTDPMNPKKCPAPIDTGRNDGVTDYAHDVQVDALGIAWVSGAGGVRGYWTKGVHKDPVTGETREATGCSPIPYGGSGSPDTATPSRFMHNSWRDYTAPTAPTTGNGPAPAQACASRRVVAMTLPRGVPATGLKVTVGGKTVKPTLGRSAGRVLVRVTLVGLPKGPVAVQVTRKGKVVTTRRYTLCAKRRSPTTRAAAGTVPRNDVLLATEENITSACDTSGRFTTYDLRGTYEGEGFKDIATTKHRMTVLDTWTPENQAGSSGCASSHYFTSRGDGITANAFYEQGVRFLDTSDPKDIRQVGWFRNSDSNTWAAYFHNGYVYAADLTRGIDVLKVDAKPGQSITRNAPVSEARSTLVFSPTSFGGLCPLYAVLKPA